MPLLCPPPPPRRCTSRGSLTAAIVVFVSLGPTFASAEEAGFDGSYEPDVVALNATALQQRGSALLPHDIPGETYNELTGSIGHRVRDMTISDNGPLSFSVERRFEEQPQSYPFALANHSLIIPHLDFETNLGVTGQRRADHPLSYRSENSKDMSCSALTSAGVADIDWQSNPERAAIELLNGIDFNYAGGTVHLIPRVLIDPQALAHFPADALLASADNWWLACQGEHYVLRSPGGVVYRFDASVSAEKWFTRRRSAEGNSSEIRHYYNRYRVYVSKTSQLNSTLDYRYEHAPVGRVQKPLLATHLADNSLHHRRLKAVELRTQGDAATETETLKRISFSYKAIAGSCGGLLDRVESTHTTVPAVVYHYTVIGDENAGITAHEPQSKCVLSGVKFVSGNQKDALQWQFSYGIQSGASDAIQYFDSGSNSDTNSAYNAANFYLPLKSVTIPTGATVSYTYRRLKACAYQRTKLYRETKAYKCQSQVTGNNLRPAVLKRTVSPKSDDIRSSGAQDTTFNYFSDGTNRSEIYREILFGDQKHQLRFKRLDRLAESQSFQDGTVEDGHLTWHQLHTVSDGALIFDTRFYWKEFTGFAVTSTDRRYYRTPDPSMNNPGFIYTKGTGWLNTRRHYLFDARRYVAYATVTEMGGYRFISKKAGYDHFNYPKVTTETMERLDGSDKIERKIRLSFDHRTGEGSLYKPWKLGMVVRRAVDSGESKPLVDTYSFNARGQMVKQILAGIQTRFAYQVHGQLRWRMDGNNVKTTYSGYRFGIPSSEQAADTSRLYRRVDALGNLYQQSQRISTSADSKTRYEYNDRFHQLSKIVPVANAGQAAIAATDVQNPVWDDPSHPAYRQRIEKTGTEREVVTLYDSFGREIKTVQIAKNNSHSSRIVQVRTYNALGQLVFVGDPMSNNTESYAAGVNFTYDGAGRLATRQHSQKTQSVSFCYASTCDSSGKLRFGVKTTDEAGFWRVDNYRALGSPANRELIETVQQIAPPSHFQDRSQFVTTTLSRNLTGFITAVAQRGSGQGSRNLTRSFQPRVIGGSVTMQLYKETHPEFGVREVQEFDALGRITRVKAFDGSIVNHSYDRAGRLIDTAVALSSTSGMVDPANTHYDYYENGLLKSLTHGTTTWTYDYDGNGDLTNESLVVDGLRFDLGYERDSYRSISRISYPSGRVVAYQHDGLGRLKQIDGFVDTVAYHPNGQQKGYTLENGVVFSSELDSVNRPRSWTAASSMQGITDFGYAYDARNNIASIDNYFPGYSSASSLSGLKYDGLSRLSEARGRFQDGGVAKYSYDAIGNITKKNVGTKILNYTYGSDNKLSAVTSGNGLTNYSFSYDGNGNVIDTDRGSYQFDVHNRLVRAESGDGVQQNTYDGHGMRTVVILTEPGKPTRTRYSMYAQSGQLMYEYDAQTGEERDHIQLGAKTIATVYKHNGVDSDDDGMPDFYETLHGLSRYDNRDAMGDADQDGLSNLTEYRLGLLPTSGDSSGNSIPDSAPATIMNEAEQQSAVRIEPAIFRMLN